MSKALHSVTSAPKSGSKHESRLRLPLRVTLWFSTYNITGAAILAFIFYNAYAAFGLLSTNIVLGGWDSALYLWRNDIIRQFGPLYFMRLDQYPAFYDQLSAVTAGLLRSTVESQRVLPVALGVLRMGLYSLVTYRITRNVHVAGLTAILTSISVGNIWLIGEYDRNSLAIDLGLMAILILSNARPSFKRWITLSFLIFLIAGTEYETMGFLVLVFVLTALAARDWDLMLWTFLSSAVATASLILLFPHWLSFWYLNPPATVYASRPFYTFFDLTFWSLGSAWLIPLALLGLAYLYFAGRSKSEGRLSLYMLVISVLIITLSSISVMAGLGSFGVRAVLLLPVPIILSLGIYLLFRMMKSIKSIAISARFESSEVRKVANWRWGVGIVVGLVILSTVAGMTVASDTSYSLHNNVIEAATPMGFVNGVLLVPFVPPSVYPKLLVVKQYLGANNLSDPIFMFACGETNSRTPCYPSELFRPYIYDVLGEHFAYEGNYTELAKLEPTVFTNSTIGAANMNFISNEFLLIMRGVPQYSIVDPQVLTITNSSELLNRPVVYITPEMYFAAPSQVQDYSIGDGIYVVPRLAVLLPAGFSSS